MTKFNTESTRVQSYLDVNSEVRLYNPQIEICLDCFFVKYLKKLLGQGILYYRYDHLEVEAYTEADWPGSKTDTRLISDHCAVVGRNLVPWKSKKQSVVSKSSFEAEYQATTH